VQACRAAGVVLGIGTDKRLLPAVQDLTRHAIDGRLGTLLHLEGQYSNDNSSRGLSGAWRASGDEAPGAGMTGPGLHALDAMVGIAGPVARVDVQLFQQATTPHPVDAVAATLRFAAGATGTLATVRSVPEYFRLQVHGTGGWAEVDGFDTLTTCLHGEGLRRRRYDSVSAVGHVLERFADAVRGHRTLPVTPESMLDTVAAFEAVIASLTTGEPVRLTVPALTI
jgi:predicted dehydrogenase